MKNGPDWQDFVLLLIDVQNDFWTEEMAVHFPDFSENVAGLLALCRREKIDIVHLRASFQPDQSDWMERYKLKNATLCVAGTEGANILPCAAELANEPVIYKQTFDGFLNPALKQYLEENGKRFVLVAGLESSVCVLLTAVSATQHGYLSAIVSDCCADNLPAHQHTLKNYPFAFDTVLFADIPNQSTIWQGMLEKLNEGL
ncbi:MAG: cysteine hydrolase [Chloroflexota bacterium]